MRQKRLFLLSCISGAVIQMLATTAPAEAAYRLVPGQWCAALGGSWDTHKINSSGFVNEWPANTSGGTNTTRCGLPVDEVLPSSLISYLEVDGYDASTVNHYTGAVRASACVTFRTQYGGSCGTEASAPGGTWTGSYSLVVSPSIFQTYPDDYPQVLVNIPSESSTVAGIYYE